MNAYQAKMRDFSVLLLVVFVACFVFIGIPIIAFSSKPSVQYVPNGQVAYYVTSDMHVVCLGGVRYWANNKTRGVVGPVIDPKTLTYKRCTEPGE